MDEVEHRLIRLETTIKTELKHLSKEIEEMRERLATLSSEQCALKERLIVIQEQTGYLHGQVRFWKIMAVVVTPIFATVTSEVVKALMAIL